MEDYCIKGICFFKLVATESKLFGFSEYLAALALMVLAWTTTDVRYKFRVSVAPLPIRKITFWIVVSVGVLTLLTDVWRAQQWYVPRGVPLTPALWQGLLGAILLAAFVMWSWFAFMRPPRYTSWTAEHFAGELYGAMLRGHEGDLAILADELAPSLADIVRFAPTQAEFAQLRADGTTLHSMPPVRGYAHDIIFMFADPRFVRILVSSAPGTSLTLFSEIAAQKRCPGAIAPFARNFVEECLENRNSPFYAETAGYDSGLIGSVKPLTSRLFSSYDTLTNMESLLDVSHRKYWKWGGDQLEAYGRLVLLVLEAMKRDSVLTVGSPMLKRALNIVVETTHETYTLNGQEKPEWEGPYRLIGEAARIMRECVNFLDDQPKPERLRLRIGKGNAAYQNSVYDSIAESFFNLVFHASQVRGPRDTAWSIQHNSVWGELFTLTKTGAGSKWVKHRVRRLLYDEVIRMDRFPNFKGANIIAFCLNVLSHRPLPRNDSYYRDQVALQIVVRAWVKRNFHALWTRHPAVAEHCLLDTMTYDPDRRRIYFARPGRLGQSKLRYSYLKVA